MHNCGFFTRDTMWFKNLFLYRFTERFELNESKLQEQLGSHAFRTCGSLEPSTSGWAAPLGPHAHSLLHLADGFLMLCLQRQDKILPPAVINELVAERVLQIEDAEHRPVRRKERENIRDEILTDLLPRAFTVTRRTFAYIDLRNQWLVVDTGTAAGAEEFTSTLRKSLGSLKIIPPRTRERPAGVFTDWLSQQSTPEDISLENECELRSADKEGNLVRCRGQDLYTDEIRGHLEAGKECIRLALTWNDRLAFTLDETLCIRRLKFLDLVQEQIEQDAGDSAADLFDAQFAIMTLELAAFLPRILELFGGEDTQ